MSWIDEMSTEEFLLTIKHYIEIGKKQFIRRKGRNYRQDLITLGIYSIDEVWEEILKLRVRDEYKPRELDREYPDTPVFFFKKELNGKTAYIKLKFMAGRGAICLSFHPSE
ncbi:hypothetical protein [Paenibacillus bovis]|uniref:Toxin n=1 Tax=Paenibacillus bovis TaxID=1616788 RepID=A0A1X9T436_9BACL|nr:hypothetical protein [Paenibacillus bovis]ARR10654.1 hypothetical protein AR543_p0046 [Paenibacillus bovis]